MQQSFAINGSWTTLLEDESVEAWVARAPAGDADPGDCGVPPTEWTSGGATIKVCTLCGDLSEAACQNLHNTTVEALQEHFPPDP